MGFETSSDVRPIWSLYPSYKRWVSWNRSSNRHSRCLSALAGRMQGRLRYRV